MLGVFGSGGNSFEVGLVDIIVMNVLSEGMDYINFVKMLVGFLDLDMVESDVFIFENVEVVL